MRIIGGRLKGRSICPPERYNARPTTDFAREGLFNVIGSEYDMDGLKVLDLFGGTGAVSFEFASRGASRVWCVEMSRENATFIKRESERLGLDNVTMVRANVFDFIPLCREKFDIIFADPPYALDDVDSIPDKIFAASLLYPGCWFILEHDGSHEFGAHPMFVKEKVYGRVHFSIFENKTEL